MLALHPEPSASSAPIRSSHSMAVRQVYVRIRIQLRTTSGHGHTHAVDYDRLVRRVRLAFHVFEMYWTARTLQYLRTWATAKRSSDPDLQNPQTCLRRHAHDDRGTKARMHRRANIPSVLSNEIKSTSTTRGHHNHVWIPAPCQEAPPLVKDVGIAEP